MQEQGFFQGLKVVELASVLAGPSVGMFLAELGAEVIKVENAQTGGDVTRAWKLPVEDPAQAFSAYYHSVNYGKKRVLRDLKQPDHLAEVKQWIGAADIVVANFKAGSAEKLGLDYSSLSKGHSRLIYVNLTAYGPNDPRPGFDALIQAETGWMSMNGYPEGPPAKLPVALMDILAAHQMKEGLLIALLARERTGQGSEVQVNLFDSSLSALANQASNWLNLGYLPQPMGSRHPNIAPYGDILFDKDGKGLLLSTGTEQHFKALCEALGRPALATHPHFETNALRLQNRDELVALLQAAAGVMSREVLIKKLGEAGVPASPIKDLEAVFDQPTRDRMVLSEVHEDGSTSQCVKTVAFQIR
ncbi:MAG: CaiB/BaiF CoA-transferase family protein, partial [Bacteroidota bacterium]